MVPYTLQGDPAALTRRRRVDVYCPPEWANRDSGFVGIYLHFLGTENDKEHRNTAQEEGTEQREVAPSDEEVREAEATSDDSQPLAKEREEQPAGVDVMFSMVVVHPSDWNRSISGCTQLRSCGACCAYAWSHGVQGPISPTTSPRDRTGGLRALCRSIASVSSSLLTALSSSWCTLH